MLESINERFREVRKALDMTQVDWGEVLGITRSGVNEIENCRRNATEKHIKLICANSIKGKYVNEDWLRTGSGEMFKKLNRQQEIAKIAADLFREEPDSFKSRLIMALANLNEDEWESLERIAKKIIQKKD